MKDILTLKGVVGRSRCEVSGYFVPSIRIPLNPAMPFLTLAYSKETKSSPVEIGVNLVIFKTQT